MNYMPAGQYIPGNSFLHRLDARVKIIGMIMLLTAVLTTKTILGYGIFLLVTAAMIKSSGLPAQCIFAMLRKLWLFFVFIFLMNSLFYGTGQVLWSWRMIYIRSEGIIQGARVVLNVMLIMVLGNVLTGTTAPMDMTTALGNLLKPLKLFRVPVEEAAMIVSIAIQFIPTLLEEAEMIKQAQTARGARFESKKLSERVFSFPALIIPVFISAFRRADELSAAMEARGYRYGGSRTKKVPKPLNSRDIVALSGSIIICLVQIYISGGGY